MSESTEDKVWEQAKEDGEMLKDFKNPRLYNIKHDEVPSYHPVFDKRTIDGDGLLMLDPEEFIFQHGAAVSKFHTSKIEVMTIDDFKQNEVANLGKDPKDAYLIRDLSNRSILVIMPDHVVKVHVDSFYELLPEDFITLVHIAADNQETIDLTGSFRVMKITKEQSKLEITGILPAGNSIMFKYRGINTPVKLYMPAIQVTARMSASGTALNGANMQVVRYQAPNGTYETCRLRLPNVFSDGNICFGSVHNLSCSNLSVSKPSTILESVWQLFAGSEFNHDLYDGMSFYSSYMSETGITAPENLKNVISVYPKDIQPMLEVLSNPEGYKCYGPVYRT